MNTPQPFTVTEAATLLNLSDTRVTQLLRDGRLIDAGTIGPLRLVDRASVDRMAAARAAHPPRPGRPRKIASE